MATPIVVLGFEHGTHLGLATGNASNRVVDRTMGTLGTNVEIAPAAARSGSYGLRLSGASATAHAGFANSANNGILGSSGTLVGSFWFRFPTLPTGDFNIFIGIGTAGGQDLYIKYLSSTGGLQAVVGASTQLGPSISANTWYLVDFRLILNANPHTLDWQIDGAAQTQVSLSAASESLFIAGFSSDNATNPGVMHVDDAVLSLTGADYPLGGHKVLGLSVDPADTVTLSGTAANFNTFILNGTLAPWNAATARDSVDEVPPTIGASADGVVQINNATGEYMQFPMTSYAIAAGESVTGARMLACGWATTTTAGTIGFRSWNGTTERTLFAAADANFDASTTAPAWVCKMLTTADVDTQTELDALAFRVGFSGDAAPDQGIHAIYAEVAVLESTGTDATATPAAVASTVAVPTPTLSAGSTVTPAVIAAVVGVPAPAAGETTVNATVTPATVAALASVPTPVASAGSTATPAAVAATASVPIPVVAAGSVVTPASVAAVTAVPEPFISAAATAAPSTVIAIATAPTPAIIAAGNATVTPASVSLAAAAPIPAVAAGATVSPVVVAVTASVPAVALELSAALVAAAHSVLASQPTQRVTVSAPPAALTASAPAGNVTVAPQATVTTSGPSGTVRRTV